MVLLGHEWPEACRDAALRTSLNLLLKQSPTVREALAWLTLRERLALLNDAAMFDQLQERDG